MPKNTTSKKNTIISTSKNMKDSITTKNYKQAKLHILNVDKKKKKGNQI